LARESDLEDWLRTSYAKAYRTACLILRNPADAEEVVQEAFLRVWRFRDAMPDSDRRDGWLYRVVVNTCVSRVRADRARPIGVRGDDTLVEMPAAAAQPDSAAQDAALASAMISALASLPEHLRIPVVLRYYVGLPEREIAVAIKRRPGTVKSRLSEARRRLAADPDLAGWADVMQEEAR
jgi:RNA polymerase sigma-70 factor, ECF subfamily